MDRHILTVPGSSADDFHSKLDKRDSRHGWRDVARDAQGVPYWAFLYQRYVGGAWRQVQDAYSEVKGDALLELPLTTLLDGERIPYYHSARGASGASQTAQQFGISPGPDFLLPDTAPTVIIESKVGEDGGTVRDKAARLRTLARAGEERGLVVCAIVDGKGWSERIGALAEVVLATRGRTYTLQTLPHLLEVPERSPPFVAPRPEWPERPPWSRPRARRAFLRRLLLRLPGFSTISTGRPRPTRSTGELGRTARETAAGAHHSW